jgi:hypothetical protein
MFGCFLTKHGFLLPMTKRRGFLIPSHMTREETSLLLSAILVWTSGWARGYPLHWLNHSRIWGPAHKLELSDPYSELSSVFESEPSEVSESELSGSDRSLSSKYLQSCSISQFCDTNLWRFWFAFNLMRFFKCLFCFDITIAATFCAWILKK